MRSFFSQRACRKSIILLNLSVILILCPIVLADDLQDNYIGYQHKGVNFGKKLPNGVRDLGGGLLSDEDYGVTRFAKGGKYMLWLERIIHRDKKGVPHWEVKDVLVFEKLPPNQEFFLSESSPCRIDGLENLDLIVLAEQRPKLNSYKILRAWLVNMVTEKFFEIPIEGIACY